MPPDLLLDTGPLVAYFNPRDEYHTWAVDTFQQIDSHVITCEPVLTEACYMLADAQDSPGRLAEFCHPDNVKIDFRLLDHLSQVRDLMHKYRNIPMDLADACLVLLAEEHPNATVITTDRDFLIYRTRNRRQIQLLSPFSSR